MKRCPITYEIISDNENYSANGLKTLSPQLKTLEPLQFSAAEQREESINRAGKMSIQGVQAKLSARLKIKENKFELVDHRGQFILKPQSEYYPQLPENEALTMSLAKLIDIEVPQHGLVYSKDQTLTYFIKRFDRKGHSEKIALEDFAQLSQHSRDTKYNSSMEKITEVINKFCTFPKIENAKLIKLVLFNFLTGNEDMHLKNFSLITREKIITLSPAYDLLNTTIAQKNTKEELALPLNGKKNNLQKKDFIDYFAKEKLQLNPKTIANILEVLESNLPKFKTLIANSFLTEDMKDKYLKLLDSRANKIF